MRLLFSFPHRFRLILPVQMEPGNPLVRIQVTNSSGDHRKHECRRSGDGGRGQLIDGGSESADGGGWGGRMGQQNFKLARGCTLTVPTWLLL